MGDEHLISETFRLSVPMPHNVRPQAMSVQCKCRSPTYTVIVSACIIRVQVSKVS